MKYKILLTNCKENQTWYLKWKFSQFNPALATKTESIDGTMLKKEQFVSVKTGQTAQIGNLMSSPVKQQNQKNKADIFNDLFDSVENENNNMFLIQEVIIMHQ